MSDAKFKKGDWVRRTVASDWPTQFGELGRLYKVLECPTLRTIVVIKGCEGADTQYFEPWQPKVGERVRCVNDKFGDATVIGSVEDGYVKVDTHGPFKICTEKLTDLAPVIDAPVVAPAQPAPLTIVAGKFYKTRDGRKVGPMRRDVGFWNSDSGANGTPGHFTDSGISAMCGRLPHEHGREIHDLVAEWTDDVVTGKPTTPPVAATVDAINEEYGPVVAVVVEDAATPKFKVGDLIRRTSGGDEHSQVGFLYVVDEGDEYPEDEFEVAVWPSEPAPPSTFTLTIDTTELHQELDDIIAKLKKIKKLRAKLAA